MFEGILVVVVTAIIASFIARQLKAAYPFVDLQILQRLIVFHIFLSFAYYLYVQFNRSDSHAYFVRTLSMYRGPDWLEYYGTSTPFIEFIGFPFVQYLGLSYEGVMAVFAFFGLIGFFFFHVAFKENIKASYKVLGMDLSTLMLFLPNMHFWTGSFGKGSIIFLGIGLFFYSLKDPVRRFVPMILGGIITYHVRPHVMLVMLVSAIVAIVFSTKGVAFLVRVFFLSAGIIALSFIYRDVLTMVAINEDELIVGGIDLTKRATGLTNAGSGIDITNYNFFEKLFAFLFRPLFIDAPGLLGLFVSVENVFYLVITFVFFFRGGLRYLLGGNFMVKTAFLSFLTVSIALAQVSGNLGLAVRQKSQIMMLFMFVVAKYLTERQARLSKGRAKIKPVPGKLATSR